jgi:hypothetical protein
MNNFFKRIIWHLLNIPFYRAVNWTIDDRNTLESWFRSGTGAKFLELLRQTVSSTTFRSVYHDSVSENARARGMQDLLAAIHRLRRFPPEESLPYQDEDVEPLPSQRAVFDGSRFNVGGGNSAIR